MKKLNYQNVWIGGIKMVKIMIHLLENKVNVVVVTQKQLYLQLNLELEYYLKWNIDQFYQLLELFPVLVIIKGAMVDTQN